MLSSSHGSYNQVLTYLELCTENVFELELGDLLINKASNSKNKTNNVSSDQEKTHLENNICVITSFNVLFTAHTACSGLRSTQHDSIKFK